MLRRLISEVTILDRVILGDSSTAGSVDGFVSCAVSDFSSVLYLRSSAINSGTDGLEIEGKAFASPSSRRFFDLVAATAFSDGCVGSAWLRLAIAACRLGLSDVKAEVDSAMTAFMAVRREVELDSRIVNSLEDEASVFAFFESDLDRTEFDFDNDCDALPLGLAIGFTTGSPPTMGALPDDTG